ncbi:MAG: NPCBM/NEW2 domain-containing protein [Dehalococcoidia bacterium]
MNDYWDRGLIGLAADPNFATNGYVYLLYAYEHDPNNFTGPKTSRLTRVTASGDTAAPSSEVVLVGSQAGDSCNAMPAGADCLPAEWPGHSVGAIKFGADGSIFLTNGDAATWNSGSADGLRPQSLDSLAGKVLHVSPTGAGLPSNPFWTGNPADNRSKVWAYGLRNPYRFNVRPGSDVLYVGDVGWGQWEEIDTVPAGVNLGWPCYEANVPVIEYQDEPVCQALYAQGAAAHRLPITQWGHTAASAAATGGVFYTGTSYPAQFQGAYFYGDYGQGFIRYIQVDTNNNLVSGPTLFSGSAGSPVQIEMGPDGDLYYLALNLNSPTGSEIRRIHYNNAQPPPLESGFVSDLTWTSMTNGWGSVEKDQSNNDLPTGDGRALTLNGTTYPKGLGAHAPSDVRYAINGHCTTFRADVGVDDEVGTRGSVVFQVWADGAKLYDSGAMTGATTTRSLSVDVTGKNELQLVVTDAGNGIDSDHGDWANARLVCGSGTETAAPTVTGVTPLDGGTAVPLTATVTATFSEWMEPSTLTGTSVTLVPAGASTPLPASLSYDGIGRTVTLRPTNPLAGGTSYTATVRGGPTGVKDLAGNPLATDRTWQFSTGGNTPPTGTITALTQNGTTVPLANLRYRVGDVIGATGAGADAEDGTLPASGLSWEVIIHHCPEGDCHNHLLTTGSGATFSFTVPDHGDDSWAELALIVRDSGSLSSRTPALLQPHTVQLTLATSPGAGRPRTAAMASSPGRPRSRARRSPGPCG